VYEIIKSRQVKIVYEVGEKLKAARMDKGYTLDDMQQITKIQKRYLTAIEKGHFEVLPGDFYTRAFIKQYGDSVGLDGDKLVAEFDGEDENPAKKEGQDEENEPYSRIKNNKGSAWLTIKESLPVFLIAALVIAIIIALYLAGTRMMNPDESLINNGDSETVYMDNSGESQGSEEGQESSSGSESQNEEASGQNIQVGETTASSTNLTVSGESPETQTVSLQAEGGQSWVSIEVDGETVESGLVEDGESLEAEFDNQVSEVQLIVGNAPVTNISLNDQTVNYAENTEDAVRHEVTLTFE